MYVIPLTTQPNQSLLTTIPVDGKNLTLRIGLRYNEKARYWLMSVSDVDAGKLLLDAVPVITGAYPAANLLEQYKYLKIGSAVVVPIGPETKTKEPDDETLGSSFMLVWGDTNV